MFLISAYLRFVYFNGSLWFLLLHVIVTMILLRDWSANSLSIAQETFVQQKYRKCILGVVEHGLLSCLPLIL